MINIEVKDLPTSKSLYNRALVLQSFYPNLMITAESEVLAEDVELLQKAFDDLAQNKSEFYCGSGAAPLRFLAIRLSRLEGAFKIKGTERLFSRPQEDLLNILKQLGCQDLQFEKDSLSFHSPGKWPEELTVNTESTSQILSGLMLASWNLEKSCVVNLVGDFTSWSYAAMTLSLLNSVGWQGEISGEVGERKLTLTKGQNLALDEMMIEPDMSCIAALAFMGAWSDGIRFWALPNGSLQGDAMVFPLLEKMGVKIIASPTDFPPGFVNVRVEKVKTFQGIEADLKSTPDLFPVLAAFCSLAKTPTKITGLQNLNSKESRRLDRMRELLVGLGVSCESSTGEFIIHPVEKFSGNEKNFTPDEDHRLAMAAALLNLRGANLKIQNPDVVQKSFPNFWQIYKEF